MGVEWSYHSGEAGGVGQSYTVFKLAIKSVLDRYVRSGR